MRMSNSKVAEATQFGLPVVKVRLVREEPIFRERVVRNKDDAIDIMKEELSDYDREVFCILNLKTDGSVINMNIVSQGTLNASLISPREMFKSSILSNAAGVIMMHNHPSGNVKPSMEDYEATARMVKCGKLLDIRVVDHIVVGAESGKTYSFCEHGEIDNSFFENTGKTMEPEEWER